MKMYVGNNLRCRGSCTMISLFVLVGSWLNRYLCGDWSPTIILYYIPIPYARGIRKNSA